MGLISEEVIQKIREEADIVEIASGYFTLKKAGRNYKALCPFHAEKTPSFIINPDKQIFHCFGCGVGGNIFNLVMKMENMDFAEAVKFIGQKLGVAINYSAQESKAAQDKEKIFEANYIASEIYHSCLISGSYPEAGGYLKRRCLSKELITELKIGYAPGGSFLVEEMKRRGINLDTCEKAGLASHNVKSRDYFHRRVMFPIFDIQKRVVGFGGRIIDNGEPKYLNTAETIVFSKRKTLYGLNFTRDGIRKEDQAIIVEGYMDFAALYEKGIDNAVASLGTALSEEQISMLKRYTENQVLCYDADSAGDMATLRGLDLLIEKNMDPRIIVLPKGDPDSFIREKGKDEFLKAVKEALPLIEYYFKRAFSRYDPKKEEGKQRIAEELMEIIDKIKSSTQQALYFKRLAEELQIDEKRIRSEFSGQFRQQIKKYIFKKPVAKRDGALREREENQVESILLESILAEKELLLVARESLDLEDIGISEYKKIFTEIFKILDETGDVGAGVLMDRLDDERLVSMVSKFSMDKNEGDGSSVLIFNRQKAFIDCMRKIKESSTLRRKRSIEAELRKAEKEGNVEEMNILLCKYQELEKCMRTKI